MTAEPPETTMRVLSHAGLEVRQGEFVLLCDPWVVGSTYWRSWWNYPPVDRDLVAGLRPNAIYITHIHWDHFQGDSLRKFPLDTRIIIPKGNHDRMLRDLVGLGFTNIVEIKHAKRMELAPGLAITSYQFGPFFDSLVAIEAGETVIVNANDSKFMGGPLHQILTRHPKVDFVLRSHSSANSLACYEYIDRTDIPADDFDYVADFARFAVATGAKYAIPFASNHCYLHRDTWKFNALIQTPYLVKDRMERMPIKGPQVQVMISGDSWSSSNGFRIQPGSASYFEDRDRHLIAYREANAEKLAQTYAREEKATVSQVQMEKYFTALLKRAPWLARRRLRKTPVTYVLYSGEKVSSILEVDLGTGKVRQLERWSDEANPLQIHTSAFVVKQCIGLDIFSHLSISKRVRYRVRHDQRSSMILLNLLFNLYEYDMMPLRRNLSRRSVSTWLRRWREVLLYFRIAGRLTFGGRFDPARYMPKRARRLEVPA